MPPKEYGVQALGVSRLSTSKLRANPHNPRMLFDLEDLTVLENGLIVGILVPLTVYKDSKTDDYVDSRWSAAMDVRQRARTSAHSGERSARADAGTKYRNHVSNP